MSNKSKKNGFSEVHLESQELNMEKKEVEKSSTVVDQLAKRISGYNDTLKELRNWKLQQFKS